MHVRQQDIETSNDGDTDMPITQHISDLVVTLPNGVLATIIEGQIEVDYDMQDAEPDVGIPHAYVYDFYVEGGEIEVVFTEDQPAAVALVLKGGDPILKQIAAAYRDTIEEACMEDACSGW